MCQVSCSNTAVVCVDSARWRLPPHSTTSCSAGSSSAPCAFLIQHLWVASWPASPGTWMRVRLDLSWLGTFPPKRALIQWSHPGWQGVVPRHSVVSHGVFFLPEVVAFCYDMLICGFLFFWVGVGWLVVFQSVHHILSLPLFCENHSGDTHSWHIKIVIHNSTHCVLIYNVFSPQSGRASHHASWNAAAEPDPGAVLPGDGEHCLPLVPDLNPAPGSFPLRCQPCLQVRLSSHVVIITVGIKPEIQTSPCNLNSATSDKSLISNKCSSYFKWWLVTYSCINCLAWTVG